MTHLHLIQKKTDQNDVVNRTLELQKLGILKNQLIDWQFERFGCFEVITCNRGFVYWIKLLIHDGDTVTVYEEFELPNDGLPFFSAGTINVMHRRFGIRFISDSPRNLIPKIVEIETD